MARRAFRRFPVWTRAEGELGIRTGDLEVIEALTPIRSLEGRESWFIEAGSVAKGDAIRHYRALTAGMVTSDAFCVVLALLVSYFIRFGGAPLHLEYVVAVALAPLAWVATFKAFGLYAPHRASPLEEFRGTIAASSVGVVLLAVGIFWSHSPLSRAWVGLTWVLVIAFELVSRRMWRSHANRLRADGRLAFRTLIVGTDDEAGRLADALRTRGSGYSPLGFVSCSDSLVSPDSLPVVGRIDQLGQAISRYAAECVFVASTGVRPEQMFQVIQLARRSGVEVRVSANLPQILTSRLMVQQVGPTMALSLRPVRLSGTQKLMKRAFDLVVVSVGLLVSLPLCALISAAIRLTSPGPVLFRQARVTKGGRIFTVYKFRTMKTNGDQLLEDQEVDYTRPFFKLHDDPRQTVVGRVLRRLSLDELPQLLNVLMGQMSLVGPRPLPAQQVAANMELLGPRHEMPAGVTGWWQINGRSALSAEEALRLDLFYIENWSLTLDLYILSKTVGAVIGRRGAF
jgi:exopolysaccharide biosynthesis polyprenyl glycosylphosphotransferase